MMPARSGPNTGGPVRPTGRGFGARTAQAFRAARAASRLRISHRSVPLCVRSACTAGSSGQRLRRSCQPRFSPAPVASSPIASSPIASSPIASSPVLALNFCQSWARLTGAQRDGRAPWRSAQQCRGRAKFLHPGRLNPSTREAGP